MWPFFNQYRLCDQLVNNKYGKTFWPRSHLMKEKNKYPKSLGNPFWTHYKTKRNWNSLCKKTHPQSIYLKWKKYIPEEWNVHQTAFIITNFFLITWIVSTMSALISIISLLNYNVEDNDWNKSLFKALSIGLIWISRESLRRAILSMFKRIRSIYKWR